MNRIYLFFILNIILSFLNSCGNVSTLTQDRKMKISIQAGGNMGGIVENTDMSVVPNASSPPEATVDAFTGATQTRYNVGIHLNQPLGHNEIETGIDYMYNYQIFNYIDNGNFYIGVRRLEVSQLMIPLTYNFILSHKADFQLKLGFLGQMNFVSADSFGILPEFSINRWSGGPTLGISVSPFKFNNGSKLGMYFDVYRGSRIYTDFYNQKGFEMPGSGFIKFGVKYQFK